MRTRAIALLLCAALLFTLAGCGTKRPDPGAAETPAPAESAPPAPGGSAPPLWAEASFPLLSAPLSEAESEAMINLNARSCARLVENYYYCRCDFADGSRALVRYEIVDNIPRSRAALVADCPADFLCESGGRLYYLGTDGYPESVAAAGGEPRREWDEPCLSLQLRVGVLYCLRADGTLLALRGGSGETLLASCAWAFVSESGIFYTAASDGRAHFFDPAARTDVTLTAEAARTPTIIGTTLYYAADDPDGRRLYALDLATGAQRRMEASFEGEADFFLDWDGGWQLRLTRLGGAAGQQTLALAAAFDAASAASTAAGELRRCRGVDDALHTDELLSPGGETLGFELVMPGGGSFRSLAADNPPKK